MIENLTTPWYIPLGIISGVISLVLVAISTYSSKKLNKIEKTKEKGGEKYHKYQSLKILFLIASLPFALIMLVSMFMILFAGNDHKNQAIIDNAEKEYGITITPEEKNQELTDILNDQRVPVTVEHQDVIHENTYEITYDEDNDKVDLHYNRKNVPDDNAPTPEELHEQARS